MVKHIILWKIKSGFSESEKETVAAGIKKGLEGLKGVIPGLSDIRVRSGLESSSADLMLDSTFEDAAALENYRRDARHNAVADRFVRPNVEIRLCMDYEVGEDGK